MTQFTNIPILAMRGNFFFPGVRAKVEVSRKISVNAINFVVKNGGFLLMVSQIDPDKSSFDGPDDIYKVGVLAEVVSQNETSKGVEVVVHTLETVQITRFSGNWMLYLADCETLDCFIVREGDAEALLASCEKYIAEYLRGDNSGKMSEFNNFFKARRKDYLAFTDRAANEIVARLPERQRILEETNLETRMELICAYIIGELDLRAAEQRIAERVKKQIADGQKEYYLREQMRAISIELGDDVSEKSEYADRIERSGMPAEVKQKALRELARMGKMNSTSPEATVIRNYLDWLCDVPWTVETEDNADLVRAREILDEDHYGLDKIKQRIVEYLAVMQLTHKLNGPILCFVGPPGVGKTSIVRSIARALGRKYLRVSLGGVRDEAEIRGHRRTYIGAIPGKIIYMMRQAACINPVLLLDEVDKMGKDNRGDPASCLLEVLDPEQNFCFTDHYLEVPYDLSKVMFICTANAVDDIPEPLLDRMEVIELNGYTDLEKIEIANKFLLKKNLALHGIPDGAVTIADEAYSKMVECYTSESGVRSLERHIAAICRKAALKLVDDPEAKIVVTPDNLHEFLGTERKKHDQGVIADTIGTARGLAWTRVGGVTLNVDATLFAGSGEVQLTGSLGDVMKESARTAISLVKSLADEYGIDKSRFERTDIHIHVPEGAVPKDGPSAGVTMATVVMSAFTDKPVCGDVAMTGEITLRGKVLPIGGLREKALAAYRVGIKRIIVPKDNMDDLDEVPLEVKQAVQFVAAETIADVFNAAFCQ